MSSLAEIHRLADELCNPHDHFESYKDANRRWAFHRTYVPGLIAQLRGMVSYKPVTGLADVVSGKGFESKVPISVSVVDRLVTIEREAVSWVSELHGELCLSVEGNIAALAQLAQAQPEAVCVDLVASLRHWKGLCRVAEYV